MKYFSMVPILLISTVCLSQKAVKPQPLEENPVTDTYHDIEVVDPYRYLEDLEDPKVLGWMKDNANYARATLEKIPGRQKMLDKFYEFDKRVSSRIRNTKITADKKHFYLKLRPQDENGKLFYKTSYEGEEKLLFDPQEYRKEDNVNYVISNYFPDYDGEKIALFVSPNGSENAELLVVDLDGKVSPEKRDRCSTFTASWLPDGNTLIYHRFNSGDIKDINRQLSTKSYLYTLGTPESSDIEFFSDATNPELDILPEELPIAVYDKTSNRIYGFVVTVQNSIKLYSSKKVDKSPIKNWTKLTDLEDNATDFDTGKEMIYYLSFKDAPNYKIVSAPLDNPQIENATTIVEQHNSEIITDFGVTGDGLYYTTLKNGIEAKAYYLSKKGGVAQELDLPLAAGDIYLSTLNGDSGEVWMSISGWTSPSRRYRYYPESDTFEYRPLSTQAEYPELKDVVVKEVMVPSHDGVMVPVSIIHKNDIALDGENPTLIYGYGSYGISITPFFSPVMLNFVINDGIFVVPHVRGGGELGDSWHRAGQKLNKPNTWKDAIATAEYLIEKNYTSSKNIGIWGGSAGGIFVGRAITERPELFAVAIPEVGVMNTVRTESTPNGPVNAPEFGTIKDKDEFKGLLEMDAYHHLEDNTKYPAVLVTAGINDPRVIAWEPAKFAARIQAANSSENPMLFYTDFEAGHGIGDSKSKSFNSFTDVFTFTLWQTGHPDFQPMPKSMRN